jgi:hypothetical protein
MQEAAMETNHIDFPVIFFFRDGIMGVADSISDLEVSTRYGLKKNVFAGLRIIDSSGRETKVRGATKVSGIGKFGGWNILLGQKIRVRLDYETTPFIHSLADLRAMVGRFFRKWHGWASRDDFTELKRAVERADSIPALIALLRDPSKPPLPPTLDR